MSNRQIRASVLALAVLCAALTAPAAAQLLSNDAEFPVRLAARVDERGRIEFGVLPPGAANAPVLPTARFLRAAHVAAAGGWRNSSPVSVDGGRPNFKAVTVRISARATGANTVELALRQQHPDGSWSDFILPSSRFFSLNAAVGSWLRSTSVFVTSAPTPPTDAECRFGLRISTTTACHYPGTDHVFEATSDGVGVFDGLTSVGELTARFELLGRQHEFRAIATDDGSWQVTRVGTVAECRREMFVGAHDVCFHAATGGDFSVDGNGTASFGDRAVEDNAIALVNFAAESVDRQRTWRITRVAPPPEIQAIQCMPRDPVVGERLTCLASLAAPADNYRWSAGEGRPSMGREAQFTTSFGSAGTARIGLTVESVGGGSDEAEHLIKINARPVIEGMTCTPSRPNVGESVRCTATVSGLALARVWRAGDDEDDSPTFTTEFDSSGRHTITLRVVGPRGSSHERRTTILVERGEYVQITAGYGHTCALDAVGVVECWGANWSEHGGYGGQTDPPDGRFTQIDAGSFHTCGLRDSGAIECWGGGPPIDDNSPTDAPGSRFVQVSAGGDHTCGIRANGAVKCWGADHYGEQLDVPTGSFAQVDVGFYHTCGVRQNGSMTCWGALTYEPSPTGSFTHVSVAQHVACGIRPDGSAVCWDPNNAENNVVSPYWKFSQLSVGSWHTCGISTDDLNLTVVCWRHQALDAIHHQGQAVSPRGEFIQVASGTFHSCAIRTDGSIECWGANSYGQLDAPP